VRRAVIDQLLIISPRGSGCPPPPATSTSSPAPPSYKPIPSVPGVFRSPSSSRRHRILEFLRRHLPPFCSGLHEHRVAPAIRTISGSSASTGWITTSSPGSHVARIALNTTASPRSIRSPAALYSIWLSAAFLRDRLPQSASRSLACTCKALGQRIGAAALMCSGVSKSVAGCESADVEGLRLSGLALESMGGLAMGQAVRS